MEFNKLIPVIRSYIVYFFVRYSIWIMDELRCAVETERTGEVEKKKVRTLLALLLYCISLRASYWLPVRMLNKLRFNNTLIILFREIDRRFSPFSLPTPCVYGIEIMISWNGLKMGREGVDARWKIQSKHVVQNVEICTRLRIHWFLMFDTTLNACNAATTDWP